jgi:hypothetical protein
MIKPTNELAQRVCGDISITAEAEGAGAEMLGVVPGGGVALVGVRLAEGVAGVVEAAGAAELLGLGLEERVVALAAVPPEVVADRHLAAGAQLQSIDLRVLHLSIRTKKTVSSSFLSSPSKPPI